MTATQTSNFYMLDPSLAEIVRQREILQACFPLWIAWAGANARPESGLRFNCLVWQHGKAEHFDAESGISIRHAVQSLLAKSGVTTVEQYIRIQAYKAKGGAK